MAGDRKLKYKQGDVVLVQSPAGSGIPHTHVKLTNRIQVPKSENWDGYAGWHAEVLYENEAAALRKCQIPINVGDLTFVFDDCIISKEET